MSSSNEPVNGHPAKLIHFQFEKSFRTIDTLTLQQIWGDKIWMYEAGGTKDQMSANHKLIKSVLVSLKIFNNSEAVDVYKNETQSKSSSEPSSKSADTNPTLVYRKGADLVALSIKRVFAGISQRTVGDVIYEWIQLSKEYDDVHDVDDKSDPNELWFPTAGETIYRAVNDDQDEIFQQTRCSHRELTIALQCLDFSYTRGRTKDKFNDLPGTKRPHAYPYSYVL